MNFLIKTLEKKLLTELLETTHLSFQIITQKFSKSLSTFPRVFFNFLQFLRSLNILEDISELGPELKQNVSEFPKNISEIDLFHRRGPNFPQKFSYFFNNGHTFSSNRKMCRWSRYSLNIPPGVFKNSHKRSLHFPVETV